VYWIAKEKSVVPIIVGVAAGHALQKKNVKKVSVYVNHSVEKRNVGLTVVEEVVEHVPQDIYVILVENASAFLIVMINYAVLMVAEEVAVHVLQGIPVLTTSVNVYQIVKVKNVTNLMAVIICVGAPMITVVNLTESVVNPENAME
jgi:hypothetical protein